MKCFSRFLHQKLRTQKIFFLIFSREIVPKIIFFSHCLFKNDVDKFFSHCLSYFLQKNYRAEIFFSFSRSKTTQKIFFSFPHEKGGTEKFVSHYFFSHFISRNYLSKNFFPIFSQKIDQQNFSSRFPSRSSPLKIFLMYRQDVNFTANRIVQVRFPQFFFAVTLLHN